MRRSADLFTAAALLLAGIGSLVAWRAVTIDAIGQINATHGRAVLWLKANTDPAATVAAYDIGRISFSLDRDVVDLGGITDPSLLPYMTGKRVGEYPALRRATFALLPGDSVPYALGIHMASPPLAAFCTPHLQWLTSVFYTDNAAECQLIYGLSPVND